MQAAEIWGLPFCYFDRNLVIGGPPQGTREIVVTRRANITDKNENKRILQISRIGVAAGVFFVLCHVGVLNYLKNHMFVILVSCIEVHFGSYF